MLFARVSLWLSENSLTPFSMAPGFRAKMTPREYEIVSSAEFSYDTASLNKFSIKIGSLRLDRIFAARLTHGNKFSSLKRST